MTSDAEIGKTIAGRLNEAANAVPPVNPLAIDELRERSQIYREGGTTLSDRIKYVGRNVAQACGFLHHYGGYKGESRITMQSQDDRGIVWSPGDRHAMKAVATIAPICIAASYGYIFTHYL